MDIRLITFAQNEMRRVGLYSGNDTESDTIVSFVSNVVKEIDYHDLTEKSFATCLDLIGKLGRGKPI